MSSADESSSSGVLVQSAELTIRKSNLGGCVCYGLEGRSASLDNELRDELLKVQEDAKTTTGDILLDAAKLAYANSTLVGTLASILGTAEERGSRVYLVAAQKQLCDLLEVLGILGGFTQVGSIDAALHAISSAGN